VELLICEIASALDDQAPPTTRRPHPDNTELLDMLDELAGSLRAQGIKVSSRIIYGKSLPDTLLDYLHGSDADLVIKDTHQHSFARRTFARNTDWHLVRDCPKPLLLTKKKSWSQRPQVVTVVDLEHGDENAAAPNNHVLEFAATLSGQVNGDLHVIHAYIPNAFAALVRAGRQSSSPDYAGALQVEKSYRHCQLAELGIRYKRGQRASRGGGRGFAPTREQYRAGRSACVDRCEILGLDGHRFGSAADSAADGVVDALAAAATLFGVRFAQRPADSMHRYGHDVGAGCTSDIKA
jgi:hypothetical protein